MHQRIQWDHLHMSIALLMAQRSPDPSTQTGAVIATMDNTIVATGYNGWPRGVEAFDADDPRWERPRKYAWMAHAERNAIDNAARTGAPLNVCKLYTLLPPCADCARGIVQVGIRQVYVHKTIAKTYLERANPSQEWSTILGETYNMFRQAGVSLEFIDVPYNHNTLQLSGEPFACNVKLLRGTVHAEVVKPE